MMVFDCFKNINRKCYQIWTCPTNDHQRVVDAHERWYIYINKFLTETIYLKNRKKIVNVLMS